MSDIGSTLREARMRARIDISEVETRTKIRAKYLRAMENEEWDLLPGPIYVKSFLRTYGDYLGLDSRMLIDDYKRHFERPTDHELRPIQALGRERERSPRRPSPPPWVAIVGVLVVVVVALAVIGNLGGSNKTPPASTQKPPAHGHRHHHRATTTATTTTTPAPPATVKLQLTPTGTVYVCLVDGTGKKLINEQTFALGQTIPVESAPKLLLTLGNASVTMKVDGHATPVAPSSSAIRLELTPAGTHSIPDTAKPTCP
jgi:cytoskeleton protein RodZ